MGNTTDIADSESISASGSFTSQSFAAEGEISVYFRVSGSGTLGTAKIQLSYDGGSNWVDAPETAASEGSNTEDVLRLTESEAPEARLKVTESGGSSSITLDDAQVFQSN